MKFEFSAIVVVYWTALLTSLYKVTLNTEIEENSEKNKQIFEVRP